MNSRIPDDILANLSQFVEDRFGLYFPENKWHDLERSFMNVANRLGFDDPIPCIQCLLSNYLTKQQEDTIARSLTIGETYFFREKKSFDALERHILPQIISKATTGNKRLKLWSAGCATGEEAYTLAMVVSRVIPNTDDWNITILATDINTEFLTKASKGIYNEWSFRETPKWVKEEYFKKTVDNSYQLDKKIMKMVTFIPLNLMEYMSAFAIEHASEMDVVLCRNVFIYFSTDNIKKIIGNIASSLKEGGWLIVSQTELSNIYQPEFVSREVAGAIVYQKAGQHEIERIKNKKSFPRLIQRNVNLKKSAGMSVPLPKAPKRFAEKPADNISPKAVNRKEMGKKDAYVLFEQGKIEESEKLLREITAVNEKDAPANALLSRIYANQGKLDDALFFCRKAIDSDSLNCKYYYLLATILQEKGELTEAENNLKRAIYLDHRFVLAYFTMGNIKLYQGKRKEAKKYFEQTISLLETYKKDEMLPESEGMTAGAIIDIARKMKENINN